MNNNQLTTETAYELKARGGELLLAIVQAILGDLEAIAKIPSLTKNIPYTISNSLFMLKYEKFLNGIYLESADNISISCRLFGEDNKERVDNALRTVSLIEKIDTLTKVEYLLNVNRSCCNGCISRERLFRIANAISNTLSEDLEFLKKHATEKELIGNIYVHSLANVGAVILAGIDGNASVENQTYVVTEFGRDIDQYALSVTDDKRKKYYRESQNNSHKFCTGLEWQDK